MLLLVEHQMDYSEEFWDGKRLDRKFSALELFGQLIGLCAGGHILRNRTVVGRVDKATQLLANYQTHSQPLKITVGHDHLNVHESVYKQPPSLFL